MPAMLDELKGIRAALAPAGGGGVVMPNIAMRDMQQGQAFAEGVDHRRQGQQQIVVDTININVDNPDNLNAEELNRKIQEFLDLQRRGEGVVFQPNR